MEEIENKIVRHIKFLEELRDSEIKNISSCIEMKDVIESDNLISLKR